MKHFKFLAITLIAVLAISCNKSNDQATGIGDVLIVSKKSGTNTVYGITIYAYTFSSFSSVKAVNNADPSKIYTLASNQGFKTNFIYETPEAQMTTSVPTAATYNFTATFENGNTDEFQDELSAKAVAVPVFESNAYSATNHQLELSWSAVTYANSYVINILDGSNVVFRSLELSDAVNEFAVKASGSGWASGFTPQSGKTYTIKLYAILYEPKATTYDIQASSSAETIVVWGN